MEQSETDFRSPGVEPAGLGSVEYVPLDRRVIALWRVQSLISLGILLVLVIIGGTIAGAHLVGRAWVGVAGGAGISVLMGVWIWWYPRRAYAAWGYRLDDRVLEIRSGVWFRVLRLLPLSRLQHVDLQRGPLERAQGLASLVLHTAGTHEAAISIPGLDAQAAIGLRDRLVNVGGDDAV